METGYLQFLGKGHSFERILNRAKIGSGPEVPKTIITPGVMPFFNKSRLPFSRQGIIDKRKLYEKRQFRCRPGNNSTRIYLR